MTCEKCKGYTHPSRCPFCSKKVIVDDCTTLQLLQYLMKLEERIIEIEKIMDKEFGCMPNSPDGWYFDH